MFAGKGRHEAAGFHADGVEEAESHAHTWLKPALLDAPDIRRIIGCQIYNLPKRKAFLLPLPSERGAEKTCWFFHFASIAQDSTATYEFIDRANTLCCSNIAIQKCNTYLLIRSILSELYESSWNVLRKSFITNGCDTRGQFWRFFIIYWPISGLLFPRIIIVIAIKMPTDNYIFAVLFLIASIITIYIPLVTAIIRRLHDVGKPGYLWILWFIPGANLYLLYLLAKKGVGKKAN
ncbi:MULTISPECIES: DUF805 domain-containing protein [unclassified Desulfovibrio]|uniref:DUF805 domain-containing protein n=1 Tax=unclassified Desulfovibrio TaxID=2593640 RepID=UPI001F14B00B|nr:MULTISPECIES: DUF805 domain-containing protein [unclassified Desulfovibrio]